MNDKFNFTYSAPTEEERKEAESFRREYGERAIAPKDALSQMRALDKKVKQPAEIFAYVFGIIGILMLGTGMCFAMEALNGGIILGTVVGCAGIAIMVANYFVYKAILKSRKQKYADKILQLSESVLKGNR